MKRYAVIVVLLLAANLAWCQNLYSSTHDMYLLNNPISRLDSTDPAWHWGVDVTTFLRDAEFSLPYTRGYTATGFFLSPYLRRTLGDFAQITLGVNLAGVAGYDGLHSWKPLVRLEAEPWHDIRLVMGTLYGNLTHGLYEPMLDRERYIYDHHEEGVQIIVNKQIGTSPLRLTSDTWLHWEELLEPWQPTQERFTMGTSNTLNLLGGNTPRWDLEIPLSFIGSHRGGQFSSLDTCIQSLFNESAALRVTYHFCHSPNHSNLQFETPFFWYQDISPTPCLAFDRGWGAWPQLGFHCYRYNRPDRTTHWLAQVGYWHGHNFIAPRGSYLFQSVSWHKTYFTAPERDMLTAKIAIETQPQPKGLMMGADAEMYYDLKEKGLDIVFGLYLRMILDGKIARPTSPIATN